MHAIILFGDFSAGFIADTQCNTTTKRGILIDNYWDPLALARMGRQWRRVVPQPRCRSTFRTMADVRAPEFNCSFRFGRRS